MATNVLFPKFGFDFGVTGAGMMVWAVFTETVTGLTASKIQLNNDVVKRPHAFALVKTRKGVRSIRNEAAAEIESAEAKGTSLGQGRSRLVLSEPARRRVRALSTV